MLLALAALFLYRLADGDRLKQFARDKVAQTWNRELAIGDLSMALFPYPHLEARDVRVGNPAWTQDAHLLEADGVKARFALLPLLRGSFVLESLHFEGLRANLEVAEDGRRSWDMPRGRSLQTSDIDLSDLRVQDGLLTIRRPHDEPFALHIDRFEAESAGRLRNIEFETTLSRNEQALLIKGELQDLAAFGRPGASSGGMVFVKSGRSTALIKGTLPISLEPQSYAFSAAIDAPSLEEAYRFLAIDLKPPVPIKLDLQVQGAGRKLYVSDLKLQMGKLNLAGALQFDRSASRPSFRADLKADRVDMVQTFLDAGRPPLPPKPEGELFRDRPLPWPLLSALQGMDGTIAARIDALRLRNGIEVREAVAQADTRDDRMTVTSFGGKLLGGSARGDAIFTARNRAVSLNLQLDQTLLGQWFAETGKKSRIEGGRMQATLRVQTQGESMKQLAANIDGPLDLRIAEARIHSESAGQAEYWLNGLFSARDSKYIDMACLSARLPFRNGLAKGEGIVGARSDASQLLTSGAVDMRTQTLDLRGRVRARAGISLGISTFASEVRIAGKVTRPQMNMDEAGAPEALARIGAAIVTGGISIVATSIWDGANPGSDPCQQVFAHKPRP
ncbi:hypothetical protein GCM10007205_09080 [Oxalicibacterium flavum]|uniref:AsmA domain-containing protein n=1 Tax=Oxalicibacterium flavum TaxID=179467 RepID=A0A8J2UK51_9BURK|nr:AsmA family protein [Oxalicibacterium flavum]GGC02027.1 hypothetical protein GCM10007205_09080 [Oxalicibacterium flavum]